MKFGMHNLELHKSDKFFVFLKKILKILKFIKEKLIFWVKKSTLEAVLDIKTYRQRCSNVSN